MAIERKQRRAGQHVVSRRFELVEVLADGTARPAGPAPYLDLRPPAENELAATGDVLAAWPLARAAVERVGLEPAVGVAAPAHLARGRANDLAARLATRMAELDREQQLQALPPVVVGATLILPAASLEGAGDATIPPSHARDTETVELRAVEAVAGTTRALTCARRLRTAPYDSSRSRVGWPAQPPSRSPGRRSCTP